ncbi:MAG: VOC family protein [Nocardioidaceae bacterium]
MKLHHIGWAVESLAGARATFQQQIGLDYQGDEHFPTVSVSFYDAGNTLVELLEPTGPDSTADYLAKHGEGIHHLAFLVDDVQQALDEAGARGLALLDQVPRPGARGTRIGFVDPGRPDGVLVEYVEETSEPPVGSTA